MNYEFSLNKTAVISLVAGSIVFGVLLFVAGLIVGSEWLGTTSAAASDATAKNNEPEGPKGPVLNDEEAAPKKTAPPKNPDQKPAAPKEPGATQPKEAPQAAEKQAAAADGSVQIIQEAAAEADGGAGESEPEYVTVQVGVFQDQNEASHLLKQIESKGYAPTFFSGQDAEARQWYAVRIGAYSDRQQAANAAANFAKQEKMKAVVRPLGSL